MSLCYNNTVRYEYQYTSDGKLHSVTDISSGVGYLYEYDSYDRLSGYTEYDLNENTNNLSIQYVYNEKNQVASIWTRQDYVYGSNKKTIYYNSDYSYDDQTDLLTGLDLEYRLYTDNDSISDVLISYTYDGVQRMSQKTLTVSGSSSFTNTVEYTYDDGVILKSQIGEYSSTVGTNETAYQYTYDDNGNITQIVDNNNKITKYYYDDLNQLIREDNPYLNKSYTYTYDNNGNRISKKTYAYTTGTLVTASETINYTYGDSTWGDRLTKYNNTTLSFDAIGNPLNYYNGSSGYKFTWKDGRRLATATKGGVKYSFNYNDEGIRTSKTVDGVEHNYILNGSRIVSEQWDNKLMVFVYDESGAPIAIHYRLNGSAENVFYTYYLEKNLQGDIIALYNASGTKYVGYTYDAWGNCTTTYYNGGGSTGAQFNPFRYRGYYYDSDLGLYYLNSRYYDSNTGRFISPDSISYLGSNCDLISYNLYTYCSNNPVMYTDPSGHFIISLTTFFVAVGFSAAIGGAIAFGTTVANDYSDDGEIFNGSVGADEYIGNSLGGLVAGIGIGTCTVLGAGFGAAMIAGESLIVGGLTISGGTALTIGLGTAFTSGALGYTSRTIINKKENFEISDMFIEGSINTASGLVSFAGGMVGGITGVNVPGNGFNAKNFAKYHVGMGVLGAYPLKYYYSLLKNLLKEMD